MHRNYCDRIANAIRLKIAIPNITDEISRFITIAM